jgi:hypothetical protein
MPNDGGEEDENEASDDESGSSCYSSSRAASETPSAEAPDDPQHDEQGPLQDEEELGQLRFDDHGVQIEEEDEDELLGMDTNPTNHTRSAGAPTHPLSADASLLATGPVADVSRPASRSHHASPTGEDPHDSHDAARRARRAP